MPIPRVLLCLGAVVATLVTTTPSTSAASAAAPAAALAAPLAAPLAPGVSAYYEMDEPAGTTVMHDSGPNHLDAAVDPSGVTSGVVADGQTGYVWEHRAPEAYPPSPERIISIPDNSALEPGSGPFTIQLRYRTHESFGNITQKGQATTPGGQWKIQAPAGVPSCLFKGSAGQVATSAGTPLNDDQWHDLTCAYSSAGVTMYVDGVYRSRKLGSAGTINNTFPMTVGGKISCDQVDVTCDYFSGHIDSIKITKAANLLPTSAFTSTCYGLTCSFDSSGATDSDGSVTRYAWTFGDGQTSTEANPSHTFATPGSYNVRLTVTDNQAATDNQTNAVTVAEAPPIESPIAYVASGAAAANNAAPTVTVPPAAAPGDRLLLVLSHNDQTRTVSAPTGVTGWQQLQSVTADSLVTTAWTKVVQPGDPGTAVTVPLSGKAKYTLTVADYTGTSTTAPVGVAALTDIVPTSSRRTPPVGVGQGDWVVSYWADKSGTTTAWTPSAEVASRRTACAADGGRVCSALADTDEGLPPGTYGGAEATTNAPSDKATMWSFVLRPGTGAPPVNQAPDAAFTSTCTALACSFDSSSTDSDGTIDSYTWDFGDGGSATQADPDHTFAAAGSYVVTLTVTDDDGATDTTTTTVVVQDTPASAVTHVGSAAAVSGNATPRVAVPASASVGDRLVLALSVNDATRTVSAPTGVTGWTQLDSITASDLRTVLWTKVVQPGDPGAQVTVPLSGTAKSTITVAAYGGVDPAAALTVARASDTTSHAARVTPAVAAPAGAWVLSYWADKSSSTTAWTPAASVTARQAVCGADGGRVCSLLADSGGAVPAGSYAGVTATTNAPSTKATVWSVVLPPAS